MSDNGIDTLLQNVRSWPEDDQKELVEIARDIEARRTGIYRASDDELKAIDEADKSGVATGQDVSKVFATFRRA